MSSITHAAEEASISERLDAIETDIRLMREKMDETEAMIRKLVAEVGPVVQEVIPMITNLVEHPMLRMLLKGKK